MLIATHIGEVAVKLRQDRESKAQACKADDKKGIMELMGNNLTYLLRFGQVSAHEDLPPLCRDLAGSPKLQNLTRLQRLLKDMDHHLISRATILATPGLLKLNLSLGFGLYHRDNLGMGLYQFGLSQDTPATRKVLKAGSNQYHVITGGGATPLLADAATLMAPDGISLTPIVAMARGDHTRTGVVLVTLLGQDQPTVMATRDVKTDLL